MRLNQLLREHRFDDFAETECATFYAVTMGRPGLPPGIYFRLLLIGYFEGIDSERGIARRAADSFALRDFWASAWKARRLAARGESPASRRGRRGAPLTRRDDREYREYLREEQRSQRGCIAVRTGSPTRQPRWGPRMQLDFHHGLLIPGLHRRGTRVR